MIREANPNKGHKNVLTRDLETHFLGRIFFTVIILYSQRLVFLIIYIKILLCSDSLTAVQLKSVTSAKSAVTPVQIIHRNSEL